MEKETAEEKVKEIVSQKREELGISRYLMGQMIGATTTQISKWEEGKFMPSSATLIMIMNLTDESIDEHDERIRRRKAGKKEGV